MANPETAQIYLIIAVAIVAMLLMAGSIILFVLYYQKRVVQEQFKLKQMELDYQKKMMEAALESQENERRRVAADLHDSIGAMLSTIRVSLITQVRQLNGTHTESLNESKKMLDDTIDSVRRISRDLMPSTLEKFGLYQAVKEMCERFQATANLPIEYHEEGEAKPLLKKHELMIFRIIQELLNNALKHAQASSIKVTLSTNDKLVVTVQDNGIGFDANQHKADKTSDKGLGLFNMENRASLVGADLQFYNGNPNGSYIVLTIPYHEKV